MSQTLLEQDQEEPYSTNVPAPLTISPPRKQGFFAWVRGLFIRNNREDRLRETIEEILIDDPLTEDDLALDGSERAMLANVLRLRELSAEDVAVPRADIIALEIDKPFAELLAKLNLERHSRLPVYRDSLDDTLGFIHLKDILAFVDNRDGFKLEEHLREPLFVSPSVPVNDLLLQMRVNRVHMALMVDEYGGVDGLITIEDLVEQIVGDIDDEHDDEAQHSKLMEINGQWTADARVTVEELENQFGPVLSDQEREEDIDTLGGLAMTLAGRLPTRGEVLLHPAGLEFKVLDADPRRINKLAIRKLDLKTAKGKRPAR